jgi:hypothetical protein
MYFMKTTTKILFAMSIGLFLSCGNQNQDGITADSINNPLSAENSSSNPTKGMPEITFDKDFHDFGQISEGEKVTYSFRFKNTGKGNLIIQTASGSCGCTVPEFPEAPLAPGETGFLKVQFNSEARTGIQEKQVTVVTNCIPNTKVLKIKAEVNPR